MNDAPPVVLTVAGSDPSGGAGVQADLKTIHQHGGYGTAVPTLITVQNTDGVEEVELLSPNLVRAQLTSLLGDVEPAAAKSGALGSPAVAHVLGAFMDETLFPWVVDPVCFRGATWSRPTKMW
jgi:hydroxymethylpyrimidine/phosphomethylpyrimidine kinase